MQDANRNVAYLIVAILIGMVALMALIVIGAPLPTDDDDTLLTPIPTAASASNDTADTVCVSQLDFTEPLDPLTAQLQDELDALELPEGYVVAVDASNSGEQCIDAEEEIIESSLLQTEFAFVIAGGFGDDIATVVADVFSVLTTVDDATFPNGQAQVRVVVTPADGGRTINALNASFADVQTALTQSLSDAELIDALGGWQS